MYAIMPVLPFSLGILIVQCRSTSDWENALAESTLFDRCARLFAGAAEEAKSVVALCDVYQSRSRNASQPVNKLPVEVLRNIFDITTVNSAHNHSVDLPQILAVSSYWRKVALAYPRLWATIDIIPNRRRAFGRFGLRFADSDLHRLQEHLSRSRDAPISCRIEYASDQLTFRDGRTIAKELVSLMYQYSTRFHAYTLHVASDYGDDWDSLFGIQLPLPKHLPNLHSLTVRVDKYNEVDTPLLSQGSSIAPVKMYVSGFVKPMFDEVDPSRLVDLTIGHSENSTDYHDVYMFLRRAPIIRRLKMTGGFWSAFPYDVRRRIGDGSLARPPLELPALKSLALSHEWVHVPYVVAPSSVEHLAISFDGNYLDDNEEEPHIVEAFFAGFYSLRSLQIPDTPIRESERELYIGAWLAGKTQLVTLLLPIQLIDAKCIHAFVPTRLPSLRYLFLSTSYIHALQSAEPAIQSILELNQQLRIVFGGVSVNAPLVTSLHEAGFAERMLLLPRNVSREDGLMEDLANAHGRGECDMDGWLRRRTLMRNLR